MALSMISTEDSIYDVVGLISRFGKVIGMAPHNFKQDGTLTLTNKLNVNGFVNFGLVLGINAVMVGSFTKLILLRKEQHYFNQLNIILYILCTLRIISAVVTTLLLFFNQEDFYEAFEQLRSFDERKKMFETSKYSTSYKVVFFVILLLFCLVIGSECVQYYAMFENVEIILYESFSIGLQLLIHLFVLLYFESYTVMLSTNFKFIKETTKTLSKSLNSNDENYVLKKSIDTIKNISLMYDDLCKGAGIINQVFSFSLFTLISLNFMEILLGFYQLQDKHTRTPKSIFWTVTYLVLQVFTLMPPGNTENEATEVTKYLTEAELDEDERLSNEKNYFLLRTLHQTVSFSACGFFPVSMSSIVGQFSTSVSFLLFMFQIIPDK